jgi:hypothetical protein
MPNEAVTTPMRFNLNHDVRIKLTDYGRKLLAEMAFAPAFKPDADGWSKEQLWQVMATFGPVLGNGFPVPFETEIELLPFL